MIELGVLPQLVLTIFLFHYCVLERRKDFVKVGCLTKAFAGKYVRQDRLDFKDG